MGVCNSFMAEYHSEDAWRELTEKLKAIPGKPLSEILIEERGEW